MNIAPPVADPILTMEPPGTAVRTAVPPGHARPYRPKLSVLFSAEVMRSLSRHVLIVAGGGHHSRSKDRQLSYLPASLILIPFPPWRRVGSPRSRTGHRARRSRRHWSPPRIAPASTATHDAWIPRPPSSRPGTDQGQRPDGGRSRWPWPAPRMVDWFWAAIVVINRVAEAHRRPHGVTE
jgi:hypothetical protein